MDGGTAQRCVCVCLCVWVGFSQRCSPQARMASKSKAFWALERHMKCKARGHSNWAVDCRMARWPFFLRLLRQFSWMFSFIVSLLFLSVCHYGCNAAYQSFFEFCDWHDPDGSISVKPHYQLESPATVTASKFEFSIHSRDCVKFPSQSHF
jgi:hypothetical protein